VISENLIAPFVDTIFILQSVFFMMFDTSAWHF